MQQTHNIRELTDCELAAFLAANGEQPFRAKQIAQWMWQKGVTSFEEMSNLPKSIRTFLAGRFHFDTLTESHRQTATDGTTKTAWQLSDGNHVESVFIPSRERYTVCVSSQAGCKLGCCFCATASLGFKRDLTVGEIFDQVVNAQREAGSRQVVLSNIVFMGMGEPLLNYKSVMAAIARITSPDGLGLSPSRITLSTAGVATGIKQMADENPRVNLAVSLHSATNEVRNKLMPVNKLFPLEALAESLIYFVARTGIRPTFEYLLLKGINDSMADARKLAEYCKQFPVKINIIPYNPIGSSEFQATGEEERNRFAGFLESKNIIVNIRRSKGQEIDAACGQLANKLKRP